MEFHCLMNYKKINKTWIFDLDGTLVKHAGYKNGGDELLPGILEIFSQISNNDSIIIITARDEVYKEDTINFLLKNKIRYDHIIFGVNTGARILINDEKPSGYITAYSLSVKRDQGIKVKDIDFFMEL